MRAARPCLPAPPALACASKSHKYSWTTSARDTTSEMGTLAG